MPANPHGAVVGAQRFKCSVVAVCDDARTTGAINSLDVGQSFEFHAIYTPPGAVLFRLSIALNDKTTLYLQLPPDHISSLRKTTCHKSGTTRPSCFDQVRCHLGHGSFTRLQFDLLRGDGLVTPAGFILDGYDILSRQKFLSIAALATASTLSLYMPRNIMTNKIYQGFYQSYQCYQSNKANWEESVARASDLRKFYNGRGGALYSSERCSSLVLEAAAATVAASSPPDYRSLLKCDDIEGQGSLLPASQQSTVSESDDTVAVATPPGYDDDKPPAYAGRAKRRNISSDDDDTASQLRHDNARKPKLRVSRASSQSHDPSTDFVCRLKALETRMRSQEEELKQVRANLAALQSQNNDLQERLDIAESDQEKTVETVELTGIHTRELEQDHEILKGQVSDIRQEFEDYQVTAGDDVERWVDENLGDSLDKYIERYIQQYMEKKAVDFVAGFKRKLRSLLDD